MRSQSRRRRWFVRLAFVAIAGLVGAPVLGPALAHAAAGPQAAAICSAGSATPAAPAPGAVHCVPGLACCGVVPVGPPAAAIVFAAGVRPAHAQPHAIAPALRPIRARARARAPPG